MRFFFCFPTVVFSTLAAMRITKRRKKEQQHGKERSVVFFLVRSEFKKKKDIINKSCGHNQKAPKCVTVVQLWLIFGIWMYISRKQEM